MRATLIVASIFAPFVGLLVLAGPQYQGPIEQQLKAHYQLTRVGANGLVLQAGSVLVVQQDNIKANPASFRSYYPNLFKKDGRVKQSFVQDLNHLPGKAQVRPLDVGERVYVTNIEAKPTEIVFSLQSCGACNGTAPDPNTVPYRAELAFQFPKGFVDASKYKEIQETIEQVFAIAPADENPITTAASTPPTSEAGTSAAAAPLPPILPPPPPIDQPPPPPKTISKGDTKEQVVAAFGPPEKMVKLDAKEIYYYKDLKVTFVSGKVSDVQ